MAHNPDQSGATQSGATQGLARQGQASQVQASASGASAPAGRPATTPELTAGDNPMVVLISGILLLGGIAAFISWGLSHAYPGR